MSESVLTDPPHAGALPGGSTAGQLDVNPICATVRSSGPPQSLSGPPHLLQIFWTFFASAFAMRSDAVASGHVPLPFVSTVLTHLPSAFRLASKNFAVSLPIAR